MSRFDDLQQSVSAQRQHILEHPLYALAGDLPGLRVFMEHHVYAVWDFMSLLKALQHRLCHSSVPWLPPVDGLGCRLMNEIVLAEESDVDPQGEFASHFQLYEAAMAAAGADMAPLHRFLEAVRGGAAPGVAAQEAAIPAAAAQFVQATFDLIQRDQLCEMAAAFALGREDLLPDVFSHLVQQLEREGHACLAPLVYYLQRHIELDGDHHGPMMRRLVESLCGDQDEAWDAARRGAQVALQARLSLWDATAQAMTRAAAQHSIA